MRNRKMYNGGDFQAGVYAGGGSIKESDIKVGAKFRLANGEVIEIKRLFIENMDENWVEFTRNGKSQETSVRSLKIFINNWREGKSKYAVGGSLESHGIRVGDTFLKTLSGGIQKVKDKNGQIVYINLANGERNSQPPFPFDDGGMVSKDLFEYYDEQPQELAEIVDFYMAKFNDGDYDYVDSKNFLKEVNAIGYTFDYGLDNTPYGLRPIGTKLEEFDEGGEVTYFINKDGVKVRSKVEPKQKLSEAEWMAKHNQSKEARTYGLGGLFGRAKNTLSPPKYPNLEGKQVSLKNGNMVQVFDQNGSELSVLDLGRIGTGERPYLVDISEVDMSSFKNGGKLIGNQKRIDMNKNGKIDAEDFKLLRSSMDGAWRNERRHVNHNEDYEVRYARKKPARTGYKGKRKFKEGGGISNFERLSRIVAKNYEGKSVKPKYQKEYGKTYSKAEAKEVGNKVAGKVKAMKKAESGTTVKKGNRGGVMVLAKQIRKEGESWKDALKRAGQQLK